MKYLILVGDGMGDYSFEALGDKTPLEAAKTPAMDFIAANGELFTLQTVPKGYDPGSDVANLSLMGYLPENVYTGRAPIEAASMGVELGTDQTAFRCNLVNIDFQQSSGPVMLDYSAGHISTAEAKELILALDAELATNIRKFYPGMSYRHLMVTNEVFPSLHSTPPHDHLDQDVTQYWNNYQSIPEFKDIVNRAKVILDKHPVNHARVNNGTPPANSIWLWGEGKAPVMQTLQEGYGITGGLISAVDLLKGIGVYAGMEVVNVPGATGYLDTNYKGKADAALELLKKHDLVFVHVEAPDEAGHQGLLKEKIQAIEDFDEKIVKPILDGAAGHDFRVVVCPDHYTPVSTKTHVGLPVPVALYDSRKTVKPSGMTYNEKNADKAGLLIHNGQEFFKRIFG